jgi:hypothetical protein
VTTAVSATAVGIRIAITATMATATLAIGVETATHRFPTVAAADAFAPVAAWAGRAFHGDTS